jgi:hypothetical protein
MNLRLIFAIMTMLAACGKAPSGPVKALVHGVAYEVPRRDIIGASMDNVVFVRARPGGTADYHVIIDELSHKAPNRQGPNVPTISMLNDNKFRDFEVFQTKSGTVICGDLQPHFNCGLRVTDGPVVWSVLFDRTRFEEADRIRSRAIAAIKAYRRPAG